MLPVWPQPALLALLPALLHSLRFASEIAALTISSEGTPRPLAYRRHASPGTMIAFGSTSRPFTRTVGEPGKPSDIAFASVRTGTLCTCFGNDSEASILSTRSRVGR